MQIKTTQLEITIEWRILLNAQFVNQCINDSNKFNKGMTWKTASKNERNLENNFNGFIMFKEWLNTRIYCSCLSKDTLKSFARKVWKNSTSGLIQKYLRNNYLFFIKLNVK